ncbi:hypothetical protein D3C73_762170 [compost metagenome]
MASACSSIHGSAIGRPLIYTTTSCFPSLLISCINSSCTPDRLNDIRSMPSPQSISLHECPVTFEAPVFKSMLPSPKSRALEPPTTITMVSAFSAVERASSNPSRDSPLILQPGAYRTRPLSSFSFSRMPSSTVTTVPGDCGDV